MGEVYRATDSRLERTVAIKVLPEHLAESAERKQRFEREAKAISQLNHPHICTLFDIGNEDGIDYLVMEYVEGETLADRLERGPLTPQEAVTAAIQIAAALDEAHRHGIVHRDLKPANIALTESGIKLLDFGLAKIAASTMGTLGEDSSSLQTQQKPLTSEGAILGTFQYMAPEQLEGKEADACTDLFALVVLYGMLTGKKAFEGKTQASLIAAILEREPASVSTIQPLSPRSLDRIVSRCLAKDPAHRRESARDVREVLSWVEDDDSHTAAEVEARGARRAWLPRAVALLSLAFGVAVWFGIAKPDPPEERGVAHLMITPSPEAPLVPDGFLPDLAISPDGGHVVYSGGSHRRLFVRRLDETEIATLVGAGGRPRNPFFSPDGEWVGFMQQLALKKISVHGGPTTTLVDSKWDLRGASWGPHDDIVFGTADLETGLMRISSAGGEPEVLTTPDVAAGEFDHGFPEHLPSGKVVLFDIVTSGAGPDLESQIACLDLETGAQKILLPAGANARFVPTGHILYVAEGALRAVRFDIDRLEVIGNPFPVVEQVNQKPTLAANYTVSRNGTLIYNPNDSASDQRVLAWVDRQGRSTVLPLPVCAYNSPSLSPDGAQLALSITDESGTNIWVYDIERGTLGKRTFGGWNGFAIWTPDGEEIFYMAGSVLRGRLMRMRADGASGGEELGIEIPEAGPQVPTSWSTVNRTLLFQYGFDTFQLSLDEEAVKPFLAGEGVVVIEARFSPDERFVAYRSNESGRDEVYVAPFPGPGGKWQISTDGGTRPMWAPAEGELFYKSGDRMMVVSGETEPTFEASTPRVLFETPLPERAAGDPSRYGVSADGQRFLIIAPAPNFDGAGEAAEIHVIVNFFEELERLSPPEN